MAYIRKRGNAYFVEIEKCGVVAYATRSTRAEAKAWAIRREAEILAGSRGEIPNKNFGDLLADYADKVSEHKAGGRWEQVRIALIARDKVAQVRLRDLTAAHLADWRDRRLKDVSAASVRREMNILSNALNVAVNEWKWIPVSPMTRMRRPQKPEPRFRRVSDAEIAAISRAGGFDEGPASTVTARVAAAFEFAVETAMRSGEIVALEWRHIDLAAGYLKVMRGKTAAARRDVPFTDRAAQIMRQMDMVKHGQNVFQIESDAQRDALFRKLRDRALIDNLHFHDARHEGITRLARKLDVLDLAKVVGIADLRVLRDVYYNPTAAELAQRLRQNGEAVSLTA